MLEGNNECEFQLLIDFYFVLVLFCVFCRMEAVAVQEMSPKPLVSSLCGVQILRAKFISAINPLQSVVASGVSLALNI